MKTKYKIFLDSQLGVREGALTLNTEKGKAKGILALLGFENPVNGEYTGQIYHLRHKLHTLMRELSCTTTFEVAGDKLSGIVETENAKMVLRGHTIPTKEYLQGGEEKECRT